MTRRETWLGGHGGAVAKEPPTKVPIGSLLPADSARGALDEKHVQVLAALEDDFEPILVHRPTMRVIDGTHRLSAEVLRGRQDVTVRFFDGSEADAYVLSAQANVRHGLPLALDERRTAAARILRSHPHWSDRSIAECVGLSGKTVGRLRRCATEEIPRSHTRTGRDGSVRPVNSAQGRLLAARLMAADPGASLRELARLAGVSTATVRDVRDRVLRGEGPVPTGRTAAGKEPSPGTPPTVPRPAGAVYRCDAPATDTVRRLVKDPSLKGSEPGRLLLRTLLATEISEQQWREIAAALPDHCAPLVRAAAARRAADWAALAGAVSRGASGAA